MRRTASVMMVASLFLALFVFALIGEPVRAQSPINTTYIMPDGSIVPSTAPIFTHDNITYTLNDSIQSFGNAIVVERSNVIIDGAGHSLKGGFGGDGISWQGVNNVTVKNVNIGGFPSGIYAFNSTHNKIISNNLSSNNFEGIRLDDCSNATITANNITSNPYYGIYLVQSSNNAIAENVFVNDGLYGLSSYNNTVESNTVNGKPLVYLEDVANYTVRDAGQLILVDCDNVQAENLDLSSTSVGAELWKTRNSLIANDTVEANSDFGIYLGYCSNDSIAANSIIANYGYGIYIQLSSNDRIIANNITANLWGIGVDNCSGVGITANYIAKSDYDGIAFFHSSGVSVTANSIAATTWDGVYFESSPNNRFCHNNFINNPTQVYSDLQSKNLWDDGYPSGGNYWSDYQTRYPNATEIDGSGIWNTPNVIDSNNTDRYPLMVPFMSLNLTWNHMAFSISVMSNSSILDLSFNATTKTLSFNVSGTSGTPGFCRIVIPLSLMSCTNLKDWIVMVNDTQVLPPNLNVTYDTSNTCIYFTYYSTEQVKIISTSAVPEFQPFTLLPLFMITTLLGALILKGKRNTKN